MQTTHQNHHLTLPLLLLLLLWKPTLLPTGQHTI
jgi:hypothetical protein